MSPAGSRSRPPAGPSRSRRSPRSRTCGPSRPPDGAGGRGRARAARAAERGTARPARGRASAAGARRVAAVELELRRAALALADLDAAPRGRRAAECVEPVDVRELLADAIEVWRPLAGSLASELHFDAGRPPDAHLRRPDAARPGRGQPRRQRARARCGPLRVRLTSRAPTSESRYATRVPGCPRRWRPSPESRRTPAAAGTVSPIADRVSPTATAAAC